MKKYSWLVLIILLFGGALLWKQGQWREEHTADSIEDLTAQSLRKKEEALITEENVSEISKVEEPRINEVVASSAITELNAGNFESFVLRCFQGEPCKFGEPPLKIYREFQISKNKQAIDSLLSFMRSQLKDPEFLKQYKDILKQMIDDFYPPQEKQFQEAAYYNYLGDLQKSLETYLDLRKRAQTDPTLVDAPNLNIANVLYDMKRFKEALPYYHAALDDYLSRKIQSDPSPVSFIEERIQELKAKLR